MFLIAGLGNPGLNYKLTRHNIGFRVIDEIKKKWDFPEFKNNFSSKFTQNYIFNNKVLLLKPMTFMNLSGKAILECCKFYKINNKNIFIFHDDLDLMFSKIKIKQTGGDGGHNGIKDINSKIGKDYNRVKIGINNSNNLDASDFVLSNFNNEEEKIINDMMVKILENFEDIIEKKFSNFLSNFGKT